MPQRPESPAARDIPGPRELTDDVLIARFGQSDRAGALAFVERFQRQVFGLALAILGDPRAAEDAAQEAFVRAWRHAGAFDPRRGSVQTWLLTITRNVAIDSLRVRRPAPIALDDVLPTAAEATADDPAGRAIVSDDVERVRRAVAGLPPAQQRAVVLAAMWGLTAREVAEREQIPLGTAKSRIRSALRRLRATLAHDPTELEQSCA